MVSNPVNDRSPSDFRLDVQGLRAVAVGLVILYHFNFLGCRGGFVGVDVFFVISGFVISGVILREVDKRSKLSLAGFYARRARRILPASALVLVVTVVASIILFGQLNSLSTAHDAIASALFVANFHFAAQHANYFSSAASPLLHFWSLAVEEQFYFVIPTLVALTCLIFARVRRALIGVVGVITVGSFVFSMISTWNSPTSAYYSIGTRAWELGVGVLVSCVIQRFSRLRPWIAAYGAWVGLAMIGLSAWWYTGQTPFPGYAAALPVLGAALVILCGATKAQYSPRSLLAAKPAVRMGDMSYSLYLWHFPVIVLATTYWSGQVATPRRLGLLIVVFAASYLSFRFVETPIRSSQRLTRSLSRSFTVGALCVALAVSVAIAPTESLATTNSVKVSGHPALDQLQKQILAGTRLKVVPSATEPQLSPTLHTVDFSLPLLNSGCTPTPIETTVSTCIFGDLHAKNLVVLYGNSQAQMWVPTLDAIGKADHFRMIAIAKPACGVFVENGYIDPLGLVSNICHRFVRWAVARMIALQPSTIVVAATLGNLLKPGANPTQLDAQGSLPNSSIVPPTALQATKAFGTLVRDLKPSHAKIVLIGNIPVPQPGGKYPGETTPSNCLIANRTHVQICTLAQPTLSTSKNRLALTEAATAAHVPFINVDPLMCAKGRCPNIVNHILVHFDTLHISRWYAIYVSSGLGELLKTYLPKAS